MEKWKNGKTQINSILIGAAPSKPAVKKPADASKGAAGNAARKPSQGTKKDATKVTNYYKH